MRKLKAEQGKEYQESLEIDSRKRKTLEDEIRELSRLEEVRRAREARVPKEPDNEAGASAQVLIVVQHPFLGRISRVFSAKEIMLAVYDWVGSSVCMYNLLLQYHLKIKSLIFKVLSFT